MVQVPLTLHEVCGLPPEEGDMVLWEDQDRGDLLRRVGRTSKVIQAVETALALTEQTAGQRSFFPKDSRPAGLVAEVA